jgi:hypothetical protein
MSIGANNGVETPPTPGKKQVANLKMSCKTMKQDENNQNYKKESPLVVGKKPNGKSRVK